MRLPGQSGFAMLIVLWVSAFLTALVPAYVYSIRSESTAALNTSETVAARALAVSGVQMAVREMKGDFSLVASGPEGAVFIERAGSGFRPVEAQRKLELGGGKVSYTVVDERGKINMNTAERPVIDSLLRLSGVEEPRREVIVDSMLDWRDENHEFHLNGAEDDHYASLPVPYGAKDGPFDFSEELLLVKGMAPSIYYGAGAPGKEGGGGLRSDITVHGDGKLNLNTASPRALEAFYGKAVAGEILLKRQASGYLAIPQNNGAVSSDVFTVESTGEHGGMRYRIDAVVQKKGASGVIYLSWRDWGATP